MLSAQFVDYLEILTGLETLRQHEYKADDGILNNKIENLTLWPCFKNLDFITMLKLPTGYMYRVESSGLTAITA
ncbi:hypothetical protein EB796_009692 [Bugula neritina]|uniref:Uncharacterized protein n=1 Tax=Bugula neritina TaxID=10212 RepID=A0A7J7JZZ9_BUGNE|nr:hypothetical protein EB796_009692 [Bugula neritina]